MNEEVDFYLDQENKYYKGSVIIDGNNYPSELSIVDSKIEVKIFDFNKNMTLNFSELSSLTTIIFFNGFYYFQLFGRKLESRSSMRLGKGNYFHDHSFSTKGFLYSRLNLNDITSFQGLEFYSDSIKNWLGNTSRLEKIIVNGFHNNVLPKDDERIEFERKIDGVGVFGAYYTYQYGGLDDGIYTVGMSVTPNITLHFEYICNLTELFNKYIDMYMMLSFLIGELFEVSKVVVIVDNSSNFRKNYIKLFIPQKKRKKQDPYQGIFIPYSSIYRDASEKNFPMVVFDNYFNVEHQETNQLLKKFINYTMVESDEEKFLGFYRILERATFKQSYHVDEVDLEKLLDRSKRFFSKKFPNSSFSKFKRAILKANESKNNTESCIKHYIDRFSKPFINELNLKQIKIDDICQARNKIIHRPLHIEPPEKINQYMKITKALTSIILMEKLGVPCDEIQKIVFNNGLAHIFLTPNSNITYS
ncbi:hypothetical protein QE177_11980 [Arsenophonus sp. aPb]|uniref:HEPN domain-containing protein n=1 Tax=Arsenophonus sp. aPb TaxID=3041619 RepID=UPI002469C119|nr:HEPN domain-containing protein [Arsenophonus sp. aPb]WGL97898.1 hypothetical protein QE177_11980 [Arsenophonus sp. aPb]